MLIGLTQKQHITLELAQEIINANPQGIIQSELAKQLVKLANANYYEIVGKNSLWNLLDEFKEKLFCVETITPKGGGIRKLYKPLKIASKRASLKNNIASQVNANTASIQDSHTPKQDIKKATIKENNTIQKSTYITESKTQNKNKSKTKTTNTLNLLQTIIADSKEGITQKDLAEVLHKQAKQRMLEIVGKNTLWKLLDKYNGVFYKAERMQRKKGYGITKMYMPLRELSADSKVAVRVG